MKKLSKIVSVILSLALCLGMASPAFAIEYQIDVGKVHVENNENGETVSWQENHETNSSIDTASTDTEIIITGEYTEKNQKTAGSRIEVGENVKNATITLKDVNIDVSNTGDYLLDYYWPAGEAALSVGMGSDVTIELVGENTLKSGYERAGLELIDGGSVTIQGAEKSEEGPASLIAEGGEDGAGIGGGKKGHAGNITITDGAKVTARGGRTTYSWTSEIYWNSAAGIGGGSGYAGGSSVGNITITGGAEVAATGGSSAAGIGAGRNGKAGDITITDGAKVTATGGNGGAGIGSAQASADNDYWAPNAYSSAGNITITGGAEVTATGGQRAPGIGSGAGSIGESSVGNITITDAKVTATGGAKPSYLTEIAGEYSGAGIGSGHTYDKGSERYPNRSSVGDITIAGNTTLNVAGIVDFGAPSEWEASLADSVEVRHVYEDGSLLYVHQPKDTDRIEYTITPPVGKEITVNGDDLTVTIPVGSTAVKDGETTVLPDGGKIDENGLLVVEGHDYVLTSVAQPTCTKDGTITKTCSRCGDVHTETGAKATGHKEVIDEAKAPTCTEDGLTEGKHCSVCGEVFTAQERIEAPGHTPGETVRENEVAAQVGVEGSYDEVVYCSKCGTELTRRNVTTGPLDPPDTPDVPSVIIPDPDVPMADGSGADATTIEDQEVPLAGLMPVAQLLEELRQYEKIKEIELPEDFKWIDHEYAQAIYWGLQKELVVDTEEDPLDPDEVITVGLMREVLTNYVELCKGLDDFVITLEGEDDELVMDLGERLTAFYGELEAYLKAQEAKAA